MERVPRKKKKKIPKETFYCYTQTSEIIQPKKGLSYFKIKTCPFYKYIDGIAGYCSLVDCEVMDQVKVCGEREIKW